MAVPTTIDISSVGIAHAAWTFADDL